LLFCKSDGQDSSGTENYLGIGGMSGLNRFSNLVAYVYFSYPIRDMTFPGQVRTGYNYNYGKTDFDGVNNLEYISHGLKIDGNIFLAKNYYLGLGLGIQLNWVESSSRERYESLKPRDPPNYFTDYLASFQTGYNIKILPRFLFNIEF
jgi:hypothetical protein